MPGASRPAVAAATGSRTTMRFMRRRIRNAAAARPLRDTVSRVSSHPFGGVDSDEVEGARDHVLRRPAEPQAEGLCVRAEDAALVVEAVVGVGEADRVDGNRLRRAVLRGLA